MIHTVKSRLNVSFVEQNVQFCFVLIPYRRKLSGKHVRRFLGESEKLCLGWGVFELLTQKIYCLVLCLLIYRPIIYCPIVYCSERMAVVLILYSRQLSIPYSKRLLLQNILFILRRSVCVQGIQTSDILGEWLHYTTILFQSFKSC